MIDTVAFKPGPFAMLDWFGTPQTTGLHVVERYRLLAYDQAKDGIRRAFRDNTINPNGVPPVNDLNYRGKWLQVLFTVDDPNVFTTPWSATVTSRSGDHAAGGTRPRPEYVCAENPYKFGRRKTMSRCRRQRSRISSVGLIFLHAARMACALRSGRSLYPRRKALQLPVTPIATG